LADLAEPARCAIADELFTIPDGEPLQVIGSIGFACYLLDPTQPRASPWSAVLALADAALYAAKREGRNRWVGLVQGTGTPFAHAQSLTGETDCEARVLRKMPLVCRGRGSGEAEGCVVLVSHASLQAHQSRRQLGGRAHLIARLDWGGSDLQGA